MKNIFFFLISAVILLASTVYSQWTEQTLPGDIAVALGIDFIDQNQGVLGGWHFGTSSDVEGNAYYTTNGGNNWVEALFPDSMRVIVGIQMINNSVVYGAGAYNKSSSDELNKNREPKLNLHPSRQRFFESLGLKFDGQENYRGYFAESTDGGQSWHPKGSFEDSVYYLVGIYFIDQFTGYVIANNSGISSSALLKTTDGGLNWNYSIPFQEGIFIRDIRFFSSIAYLVYENSMINSVFITSSTDGGLTWSVPLQLGLFTASKVTYSNENTILISGVNAQFEETVLRSSDGGGSWQTLRNYDVQHSVTGVEALWNTTALLVFGINYPTGSAYLFTDISLDAGVNWTYFLMPQFQDYSAFNSKMVDESRWYLTGTQFLQSGFVLFTDNSGGVPVELTSFNAELIDDQVNLNWTTASELNNLGFEVERKSENSDWRTIGFVEGKGTTTEIQNYFFIDDLFGVNEPRLIYRLKQIDFNGTYDYSDEIEVEKAPASFSIEQNYPNPFNPSTKIKFTIPSVETTRRVVFTTLRVYDILGNEIATLVNEEKPAGEYEVEFNVAQVSRPEISSGVYFYQLQAGTFVQTKKMVYLK